MSTHDLFDLHGRVALVTGASSGIGLAISEALAEAGARVVMTAHHEAPLREACAGLADGGLPVEPVVMDVAVHDDVQRGFAAALERHGRIDCVFANAGISAGPGPLTGRGRIESVRPEDWARVLGTNLSGVFYTMQAAAAAMRPRRSGRIVVTASSAGLRGDGMVGYGYVASKAAVLNLVRQAAIDLAPDGVLVNAIAPGPMLTNIGDGRMHDAETARLFAGRVPLGRLGQPDEIKGVALLLASAASSYISGSVISVDGGVLAQ